LLPVQKIPAGGGEMKHDQEIKFRKNERLQIDAIKDVYRLQK